jgi:UDP-glucose 4-epimerase
MKSNIKTIVIGGAGAIGSNLVRKLLNENHNVLVLDNLSSGFSSLVSRDANFEYCDIRDKAKLQDKILRFDPHYIYNLAAHFANQNSVDYPFDDINTNIIGVVNVLECCKELKNLKKYVYASSSCVYGNSNIMSEKDSITPHETPYAINKYVAELYSMFYSKSFGLPIVNVRIFNTYGPGEYAGVYRNVIPNFISKALANEDILITGTGKEIRDFTYVDDTCNLLSLAANSKFKQSEIFNSGTGSKTTIEYLAKKIISDSGSLSKIKFVDKRDWDGVDCRVSDITKSEALLSYKPETNLDTGLLSTIQWHKREC